jgi:hypothetical protein
MGESGANGIRVAAARIRVAAQHIRVAAALACTAALAIASAAVARIPDGMPRPSPAAADCAAGTTVASASGARLVLTGSELYGCADASARAVLLDTLPPGVPPEAIALPTIRGQFAAYALQKRVRIADITDGRSITFDSSPVWLRVNRFGRAGWIAQRPDGVFEVHRADLAGRDLMLDESTRIRYASLTVRRGKLQWRNASRLKRADFDGQRGDRAPIDDPNLRVVPGESEVHGTGVRSWRFAVEVEDGLPIDDEEFARAVEDILFAPVGWLGRGTELSLQRVDRPPFDFRVTLAKPRTVDRLCLPLHTGSRVSCENRGRSVINWLRWSTGSPYWTTQRKYRRYLINHEVGHSLGHPHRYCSQRGAVAPVMQQQTGPATPCVHGFWPKQFERRLSTGPYDARGT